MDNLSVSNYGGNAAGGDAQMQQPTFNIDDQVRKELGPGRYHRLFSLGL